MTVIATLYRLLCLYHQRYCGRRQLRGLPPEALKDLGLSRCDAEQEGHKPFWQD